MIETAYLIDLFEIFSNKSMERWLKDSEKVLSVDIQTHNHVSYL